MLGEALAYPRNTDDWLTNVFLGGVMVIFSICLFPAFIVQGYIVRVLRSAALDDETPPSFDEMGDLLVDGLKAYAISIGYMIIPVILFYVIGLAAAFSRNVGLLLLGWVIAIIPMFVVSYILPVALTVFALEDRVDDAFNLRRVTSAAFTSEYFVAVVLSLIVGVVFFIVFTVIAAIGLVFSGVLSAMLSQSGVVMLGFVLLAVLFLALPFIGFYLTVVVNHLYARGCAPALLSDNDDHDEYDDVGGVPPSSVEY